MELCSPKIKKFFYFLKKAFLIYRETEPTKFLIFSQKSFSYISGNGTF